MITIIDYGVGNINAFVNVYKRLDIPTKIAKTAGISKKRAEEIFWHHTQFVPFDERVYKQSDQCHPARIRLWVKPQETKLCTIIDC